MNNLFEFEDYKHFLNDKLDELDAGGRGARARMSRAIGCQTAYTAQVLRGSAHFNLEQAESINDFLGHTEEQSDFFLLLVQVSKAGTLKLRSRFQKQIRKILEHRSVLKNRLGVEADLAADSQRTYYSSWHFGAIHALVSVPGFRTAEKIAERLRIDFKQVSEALDFLLASNVLQKGKRGELLIGKQQIHLGSDAPMITNHHTNWRLQAIRAAGQRRPENLHYSSAISISKKDEVVVREKLIQTIARIKPIIRNSLEEEIYSLNLDFFRI